MFCQKLVVKPNIRPDIRYPALPDTRYRYTALGLDGYATKTVSGASLKIMSMQRKKNPENLTKRHAEQRQRFGSGFSLHGRLDPDPHSECGSGSRRSRKKEKMQLNDRYGN
jgi:hypothetical protein